MFRMRCLVLLILATFACGCREAAGPKNAPKAEIEYCPSMKLEIDPNAPSVYWSRWWGQARVRLFIRSSGHEPFQLYLPQGEKQTTFFIRNLPKSKAGDEFVVELWDDRTTTPEEQAKLASMIAAGSRLVIRNLGDKTYAISPSLVYAPEIDVIANGAASWSNRDWQFLGKASAIVGDNGLPNLRHANPISIVSSSNHREIIGKLMLHAETGK